MAYITKSDSAPAGPVYAYSALAALQQAADRGDAAAAVTLAQLPAPEQRIARGLVTAFAGKAASGGGPPRKARPPKPPKPPRQSMKDMWRADLHDPDPVRRLTAARALAEMGR